MGGDCFAGTGGDSGEVKGGWTTKPEGKGDPRRGNERGTLPNSYELNLAIVPSIAPPWTCSNTARAVSTPVVHPTTSHVILVDPSAVLVALKKSWTPETLVE